MENETVICNSLPVAIQQLEHSNRRIFGERLIMLKNKYSLNKALINYRKRLSLGYNFRHRLFINNIKYMYMQQLIVQNTANNNIMHHKTTQSNIVNHTTT